MKLFRSGKSKINKNGNHKYTHCLEIAEVISPL